MKDKLEIGELVQFTDYTKKILEFTKFNNDQIMIVVEICKPLSIDSGFLIYLAEDQCFQFFDEYELKRGFDD